jgi:hypothetical protein
VLVATSMDLFFDIHLKYNIGCVEDRFLDRCIKFAHPTSKEGITFFTMRCCLQTCIILLLHFFNNGSGMCSMPQYPEMTM